MFLRRQPSWNTAFCLFSCGRNTMKNSFTFNMLCTLFIYWCLGRMMEKAMAPHSSTLAWKIPWTEEPGGLQSMGSRRVGHNWATSLSLFTFLHWRRQWQPTPLSLPGEPQGQGSLVGCCLWGCTESDTTEVTQQQQQQQCVCVNSSLPVHPTSPLSPWCPQFVFFVCLFPLQISSVSFF